MMSRRASPSARTIRTAPTAPCIPVACAGAPVPRAVPPAAGAVAGIAPARAWKVDRSVAQGRPADAEGEEGSHPPLGRWLSIATGGVLAVAALVIYLATRTDRFYDHF